ncbi:DUF4189 domain-containing protein [Lysobacter enzymogenes]|uniref:DUF4189 domain-containing protein n=1 Tax=Lysobacter enzymogenes TaxID=69 RepID=UPI00384FEDEB
MRLKILIAGIALLSAASLQVAAEQGCRDRTARDAKSGSAACVHASSSDGGDEDSRIHDGYGAFASRSNGQCLDESDPDDFFETAARAGDSALTRCRSSGGAGCKIVATFKNECAAAVSRVDGAGKAGSAVYVGKGANESIAKADARARCAAAGSPICDVAVAQCVLPWSR